MERLRRGSSRFYSGIWLVCILLLDYYSMKSNRMRIAIPEGVTGSRLGQSWLTPPFIHKDVEPVNLSQMSPPVEIPKVDPDQVVQDILVSTLLKVQRKASPEVQLAAAKYLEALKAGVL